MAEFSKRPNPQEFIEGAIEKEEITTSIPESELDLSNRPLKVPKTFTLRTDEKTLAEIKWVIDRKVGYHSIQQWLRDVIAEALDRDIKNLLTKSE